MLDDKFFDQYIYIYNSVNEHKQTKHVIEIIII